MNYREVLDRIDLRELMVSDRRIIGDKPMMISCIWHDDRTPSLAIYRDHAYCYSCGRRVSALEWIADNEKLDIDNQFKEVIEAANKYVGLTEAPLPTKHREVKSPFLLAPMSRTVAEYSHNNLGNKRQWFLNRGLTNDIIDSELLGYLNNAYAIPVWNAIGQLMAMRYRRDDTVNTTGNKYWGTRGRNQTFIYNQKVLTKEVMLTHNNTVVICEGELDALRLWCENIPAISFTNGAGGFRPYLALPISCAIFYNVWKVIIAFDMDDEGKKEAGELAERLGNRAKILEWDPNFGKDITDLVQIMGIEYLRGLIEAA